jgi:hypothetical protein
MSGLPFSSCRSGARPAGRESSIRQVKRQQLILGKDTITVDVADEEEVRRVGLMFRKTMPENEGMLFVFEQDGIYPFWMKNTELPLSIAFIDRGGTIVDVQDMAPLDELSHHAPRVPVLYALEMNQGWFRERGVKPGDRVQLLPTGKMKPQMNTDEHG